MKQEQMFDRCCLVMAVRVVLSTSDDGSERVRVRVIRPLKLSEEDLLLGLALSEQTAGCIEKLAAGKVGASTNKSSAHLKAYRLGNELAVTVTAPPGQFLDDASRTSSAAQVARNLREHLMEYSKTYLAERVLTGTPK